MYFQTLQSAGTEFDYTKMYEIINAGKNTVIILIPAILIIVMFISAFIIYEISKYVMVSFTRKTFSDDSKYRNFKINGALSLITIALLLTSALSDSEMYSNAVLNFSIISSFVYLANGFAVICHYLIKKINNKVLVIISAIAVIIMTFMSVFMISSINGFTIIFFIGLLDTTFDFRKIRPNVIKRLK